MASSFVVLVNLRYILGEVCCCMSSWGNLSLILTIMAYEFGLESLFYRFVHDKDGRSLFFSSFVVCPLYLDLFIFWAQFIWLCFTFVLYNQRYHPLSHPYHSDIHFLRNRQQGRGGPPSRQRGRGFGRGRGRGRGPSEKVSAEDLDADLEKYHAESMQIN